MESTLNQHDIQCNAFMAKTYIQQQLIHIAMLLWVNEHMHKMSVCGKQWSVELGKTFLDQGWLSVRISGVAKVTDIILV